MCTACVIISCSRTQQLYNSYKFQIDSRSSIPQHNARQIRKLSPSLVVEATAAYKIHVHLCLLVPGYSGHLGGSTSILRILHDTVNC